jgi:hypothetical protein
VPISLSKSDSAVRSRLAFSIVGLSMLGIIAVSIVLIFLADDQTRPEMSRLVFASVLPLFGTWVGTVLAFYFARENLQAATDSTVRLTQKDDPQTPVSRVMIAQSAIKKLEVADAAAADELVLSRIAEAMTNGSVKRMPVLLNAGSVVYVIHLSTLAAFADTLRKDISELTETVSDLLANADLRKLIKAFGFVAQDAVLGDARSVMRSTSDCNDVFVTANGRSDEAVIGWLTNTLLAGVQ